MPTDWADTRVLNGEVGDYVTIARKDRNSEDWYLGSVTDENGAELEVPLTSSTPAQLHGADLPRRRRRGLEDTRRFDRHRDARSDERGDTLTLRLAPGGGQAIRFVPEIK